MLTWRAISRLATIIRQGSQFQKQLIHPSRSLRLQALQRPNTPIAKLRFRADGKPRSKLIGIGFGILILCNLSTLHTLFDVVENTKTLKFGLAVAIYIQREDTNYDSVDFDDPISTLSYFKKLYHSFTRTPEAEVDEEFNSIAGFIKTHGPESELKLHHILRLAAQKVHAAFQEFNQDTFESFEDNVPIVCEAMMESTRSISELLELQVGIVKDNGGGGSSLLLNPILNPIEEDVKALNDYEALG